MLQASGLRVALRAVTSSSVMVLGLAATLVLSAPAAQAQISFLSAPTYAAGDNPYSIAVGDLDGDGDLDLATANFYYSSDNVSVLKNNGNGTFAAPQNFAVGDSPNSITVGDLDGDGDLDLVTANDANYPDYRATVSVLKNNGNATFAAPQNFAVGASSFSLTIGDLDGDGDLDLATANDDFYSTVSVLKNNGTGTFAAAQSFAAKDNPISFTIRDLDGDGDLDLATANPGIYPDYIGTVSVLKNNGNGTFAAPQNFATGDFPNSITVGDLDGDGDLDLATANPGIYPDYIGTVSVLKNNGNGTFVAPQSFATGDFPISITVGDLDGDGDLDLATANRGAYGDYSTVSVLKNNGDGTFTAPQNFAVGNDPLSITVGDLDGDGDLDLATVNRFSSNVSVLKNDGNGTFAAAQSFAVEGYPSSITVGDLDGDGDLDLVTANSNGYPDYIGTVSVLKNNGNGTFAAPQNFATGEYSRSITVGDLDGDGDLDLATANRGAYGNYSTVSVLKNNGDGTFAAPQNFAVGDSPLSITVGDLDRDGDLDLVTANSNGYPDYIGTVSELESTTPTLQLSPSSTRTSPTPLAGGTVSGNIYVFASGKDTDFLRVQFYLDDPDRSGEPLRLERSAPFDFAGGTNMDPTITQANPFDTTTLSNGTHTITATFARTDGTFRTITSTFTVAN